MSYLVKLKRTGFETVLGHHNAEHVAQAEADALNAQYQTDEYYVEAWDAAKFDWPETTVEERLAIVNRRQPKVSDE